uniref:Origin recognition complex subunit 4 n=1 Tax=Acrobeloides nanus TaxID=290746 RepID=A0A914E2G1_9BILA
MVCKEFEGNVDVFFVDAYLHSETQASKIYDSDMESNTARIVVVDRFENYALKAKQQLLYRMLDASRNYPWFVICVSSREDCMSLLEKRVRSRLSNLRIRFSYNISKDSYLEGSLQLLSIFNQKDTKWDRHIKKLLDSSKVQSELENLSQITSGFESLRKVVVMYAHYVSKLDDIGDHAVCESLFLKCIRLIYRADEMDPILEGLNLRELCLLNCLIRLTNRERKMDCSFKKIVTEYISFANQYDNMMKVENTILYKDLNELCNSGILVLDSSSLQGHLEFRKVRLGVERLEVQRSFECLNPLPTNVRHWLEEK